MNEIGIRIKPVVRKLIRDGYTKKQIEYFIMNAYQEIFRELDKKPDFKEIAKLESRNKTAPFVEPPCDTEVSYN